MTPSLYLCLVHFALYSRTNEKHKVQTLGGDVLMYTLLYILHPYKSIGIRDIKVTDERQTDTNTYKPSTATLTAHAHRRLITINGWLVGSLI